VYTNLVERQQLSSSLGPNPKADGALMRHTYIKLQDRETEEIY
jgi:hypothetical protein